MTPRLYANHPPVTLWSDALAAALRLLGLRTGSARVTRGR